MLKEIPRAAIATIAASFISAFGIFYQTSALAQAEVVDPVPLGGSNTRSTYNANAVSSAEQSTSSGAQISAEFYYQFQALQQEVMQLRGLAEEQAHEIKKLKQQQLDNYLDLDRRMSDLRGGAHSAPATNSKARAPSSQTSFLQGYRPAPADELKRYREALDLQLKKKDSDGAIDALNQHLLDYPNGRYVVNAQYWLGEIWLMKEDYEQARSWFTRLINEFPGHKKAHDAKFKLARVYHLQGNIDKARELLEEVAQSGSSAAGLAKDYLNTRLH